jgi:hypothetical protein
VSALTKAVDHEDIRSLEERFGRNSFAPRHAQILREFLRRYMEAREARETVLAWRSGCLARDWLRSSRGRDTAVRLDAISVRMAKVFYVGDHFAVIENRVVEEVSFPGRERAPSSLARASA